MKGPVQICEFGSGFISENLRPGNIRLPWPSLANLLQRIASFGWKSALVGVFETLKDALQNTRLYEALHGHSTRRTQHAADTRQALGGRTAGEPRAGSDPTTDVGVLTNWHCFMYSQA